MLTRTLPPLLVLALTACGGSFKDADGDGHAFDAGDCDDQDPTVHPGAGERINGADDDCDGTIDEDTALSDDDADGFAEVDGDCDDGEPEVHPGSLEVADGRDQDCDGIIDEETEAHDDDLDGFAEVDGDCDDANVRVNPATEEVCGDGLDNDCSGAEDDLDADLDGFIAEACGGDDCDDAEETAFPGADELTADNIDNDCNGDVDEWYPGDTIVDPESGLDPGADDVMGYDPDASFIAACTPPSAYSAYSALPTGTMMPLTFVRISEDDGAGAASSALLQSAVSTLDSYFTGMGLSFTIADTITHADSDLTSLTETEARALLSTYADEADTSVLVIVTNAIALSSSTSTGTVKGWAYNPLAARQVIVLDQSYLTDETFAHEMGHYFGLPHTFAGTHDGSNPERVDGSNCEGAGDQVCDTPADPGPSWYNTTGGCSYNSTTCVASCGTDANSDSYSPHVENVMSYYHCGAQAFTSIQEQQMLCVIDQTLSRLPMGTDNDGDGFVSEVDCDDDDASANPQATEYCDGVDNDCDGIVDSGAADAYTLYLDADGDGYGDAAQSTQGCSESSSWVTDAGDCDDTDAAIYPGAEETCSDTTDYNCDGSVGYDDADGDGHPACEECDDSDASVHPGATETCMDLVDANCDGDTQDGCGLMEGTLCGLVLNADAVDCVDATGTAHDPRVSCPSGYDQVYAESSDGWDDFYSCAATLAVAECDGSSTYPCDMDAVPEAAACGLYNNDGSSASSATMGSCGETAGYELAYGACPPGFTLYGYYNNGSSTGRGFATCLATSGAASTSTSGFVCDLNHNTYAWTSGITCPGGHQPEYGSCPSNCTVIGPVDAGLSSGQGWTACVCD